MREVIRASYEKHRARRKRAADAAAKK